MPERTTYHHGDLKRALLEAGLAHARTGGPDAVVLREVARECGVTVPAVYRHYADRAELLTSLAMAAQAKLAGQIEQGAVGLTGRALLAAVGVEYIRWALTEPGWFALAFGVPVDLSRAANPEAAGEQGRTPFQLLNEALDEMVAAGEMPPESRPGAEVVCWSAVHGFAVLASAGPFRGLPPQQIEALTGLVVERAIRGVESR